MQFRALVVEDDPKIVEMVTDALASLEHECTVVTSQDEAIKRLKANEYDYMLLAIRIRARSGNGLPRIQNTENLLEKMSRLEDRPMPPAIIMSDYVVEGLEKTVDLMRLGIAMSRRGAVDVIAKPFPHAGRTLDRVIKRVLGLTRPDVASIGERLRSRGPGARKAAGEAGDGKAGWLTATEAARLLMRDTPGLGLAKARSRVSTAAGKGRFESVGIRRSRRIEPKSFDSWRLKQRDRGLDQEG